MSTLSKTINTFMLSIVIMALIITVIFGFMLGPLNPLPWAIIFCLIIIPVIHNKMVKKSKFVWHKSMSTGIHFVDQDHKKLITLINKFQHATEYNVNEEKILAAMDNVLSYTKYHFAREEELMILNNYKDFAPHKKQHEKMITMVSQCIEEYRKDKTQAVDHILSFLQYWLINHINHTDQEYVPFLKIKTLPSDSSIKQEHSEDV